MRYFTYPWKEGELEELIQKPYTINNKDDRFIGPLLPFLGGVLIGGLFLPRPNQIMPYGPVYANPPIQYIPPTPYTSDIPTYSTPVSTKIK